MKLEGKKERERLSTSEDYKNAELIQAKILDLTWSILERLLNTSQWAHSNEHFMSQQLPNKAKLSLKKKSALLPKGEGVVCITK